MENRFSKTLNDMIKDLKLENDSIVIQLMEMAFTEGMIKGCENLSNNLLSKIN